MTALIWILLLAAVVVGGVAHAMAGLAGMGVAAVLCAGIAIAVAFFVPEWALGMAYVAIIVAPLCVAAATLGGVTSALFRSRRPWLGVLPVVLIAAASGLLAWNWMAERDEDAAVRRLILEHPGLAGLLGGEVKAVPYSKTTYSRGNAGRHEYALRAGERLWAVVDVQRHWFGEPEIRLACVTRVGQGHRQAGQGPCDAGVVSLDDPSIVEGMRAKAAEKEAQRAARAEARKKKREDRKAKASEPLSLRRPQLDAPVSDTPAAAEAAS